MQAQASRHEEELQREVKLVKQVAEASLAMSNALSNVRKARDVAASVDECRGRASHNLTCASQNRTLASEKRKEAEQLQLEALELSTEAQKLKVLTSPSFEIHVCCVPYTRNSPHSPACVSLKLG